jgi:hypothetical protein
MADGVESACAARPACYDDAMAGAMKVADLTVQQLELLVRQIVDDRIAERLGDDDWPMDPDFVERIVRSIESDEARIPASEVAARLGIEI